MMKTPSTAAYDLVVIGGGSAGLTAAKLAATFDKSVVIIEQDRMGGVRYDNYKLLV
jgi:pyruvate/2-oxoglutarate dehydrogenase complex dihydrolipoamide dehydrogenase (E3) component